MKRSNSFVFAIVMAVVGCSLGAFACYERRVGWAVSWPRSWFVAVFAIVPLMLALMCVILAIVWRTHRRALFPWLVAALGFGASAYGLRGANASLNPLNSEPVSRKTLTAGHPTVLLLSTSNTQPTIEFFDLETHGHYKLSTTEEFGSIIDGYATGMWWSPVRSSLFVRTSKFESDAVVTYSLGLGGAFQEETLQPSDQACSGTCTLMPKGEELACAEVQKAGPLILTCRQALSRGAAPTRHVWRPSRPTQGIASPSADGSVFFSARCAGADVGDHCVVRANADGTSVVVLGDVEGDPCLLVPSPDGSHVAVAAHGKDDACNRVWMVDASAKTSPIRVATLEANTPLSYQGIHALIYSADGSRLALLTDHAEGCAGYEGISTCPQHLMTMLTDGRDLTLVSSDSIQGDQALVWMP